jgi:hypothetical protein
MAPFPERLQPWCLLRLDGVPHNNDKARDFRGLHVCNDLWNPAGLREVVDEEANTQRQRCRSFLWLTIKGHEKV